ncbi:MAG: thioredoxin domain-containing protein [Bryobacteraceae bacterium]|jgi:protein-disulfide isomerase
MRQFYRYARWAALPLALLLPLGAQDKKKNSNDGITREQADQILDELRQIRQLLEKQAENKAPGAPTPAAAKLHLEGAPMLGSKSAPITMVEFTDYQCPFCQRFHMQVYGLLKKDYIDTGKVRFFSRDLPLDSLHPNAIRAAQAGRCAGDQGQFWTMRDVMATHPDKLDMDSLVGDASALKMDKSAFRTCVESGKYKEAVQGDVLEAMKIGADGTPAFVVGKSTPDGVDGNMIVGAQPYSLFEEKFKQLGVTK